MATSLTICNGGEGLEGGGRREARVCSGAEWGKVGQRMGKNTQYSGFGPQNFDFAAKH